MVSESNAPGGESTSAPAPLLSLDGGPTKLGKYEIIRRLGAGGMGTVYLAVDSQLKRTVALKVLPKERTENETLVRRFEAEAQSAAQLRHENIVTVFDAGRADGHLFIALEFVDGTDIYELVAKRGSLPLKRSIDFVKQVTRALEHLHQRGFVHRDIKPSNLLVTKEGMIKVTDMGLARAVDESLKSNITREGTTVGTVDYMAPEQARDSQAADIRSDIYSLGCTWYQMLTGEPPYPTGSVTNKLYSHISKPRPDPRMLNRTVPEEVVIIMHRMMARKAADRHQTPADLLEDLESLAKGNKRLDELLQADADEEFPPESPPPSVHHTPARGIPARSPTAHGTSVHDSQIHATPARGTPAQGTPAHGIPVQRSPAHGTPAQGTPAQGTPVHATPARGTPSVIPPRQTPGRTAPTSGRSNDSTFDAASPPRRMPARKLPGSSQNLPSSGIRSRRAQSVADEPITLRGEGVRFRGFGSWSVDWKSIAIKGAPVLGGLLAVGFAVWMWNRVESGSNVPEGPAKSPFQLTADGAPDPNAKAEVKQKTETSKTEAKTDSKASKAILVEPSKPGADDKFAEPSPVLGRPEERKQFPDWVRDVWEPSAAVTAKGAVALKTITVGRVDDERADFTSLAEAFDKLPEQGGVIELRGRGPFLLPPVTIAKRGRVVITGAQTKTPALDGKNASTSEKPGSQTDDRPLIAFIPRTGGGFESGILATGTALTLYGVHLVAFADEFPGDHVIRLVDVRAGDLTVRKSSVTLVGRRSGPTIAFSLSAIGTNHPARVLLDRTFVRGSDLTGVDADLQTIDMLAINSLFVTGRGPAVHLAGGSGEAIQTSKHDAARIIRLFSCTTCTEEPVVLLHPGTDSAGPPVTKFQVMNSVFGSVLERQAAAMIALNRWPINDDSHARVKNVTWSSTSFSVWGWPKLVQGDGGLQFGTDDGGKWAKFWGTPGSTFDYRAMPFPAFGDLATVEPVQFKPEGVEFSPSSTGDTAPRGCAVALLSKPAAETIRRADAFSRRPSPPAPLQEANSGSPIKDVNLDNSKRDWEDLAKWINSSTGTRFRVHGKGKKVCGPIRVTGKSVSIEFVEPVPLIIFDGRKVESGDRHQPFISVTDGSIEIVHANFRIEPSTRPSPRWLLDIKNGSFAIRDSTIHGPPSENPGYEGLIHFSSDTPASRSTTAEGDEPFSGQIRNSFLCTVRSVLKGDLPSRGRLFVHNSILAGSSRVFDLRVTSASPDSPVLDLRSSTLSSGGEYFHFDPNDAARPAGRVRLFAEDTVFAPPVQPQGNGTAKPVLVGGIPSTSIQDRVDWWEYACAYSNRLGLPGSGSTAPGLSGTGADLPDPLAKWRELAGSSHIVRSIADANAVLLSRELPQAGSVISSDFHLKSEAKAATWSDIGTAIGARLVAVPAQAPLTPKEPADRKTSPKHPKKPATQTKIPSAL